jgi:hypothetical protein
LHELFDVEIGFGQNVQRSLYAKSPSQRRTHESSEAPPDLLSDRMASVGDDPGSD